MNHMKEHLDKKLSLFNIDSYSRRQVLESEIELLKMNKSIHSSGMGISFIVNVPHEYAIKQLPFVQEALDDLND